MNFQSLIISAAIAVAGTGLGTACSADELDAQTAYAEASLFGGDDVDAREGDDRRRRRRHPGHLLRAFRDCYEVEWPVSLVMPGGEAVEVASFEAARTTLRDWREANPDVELSRDNRPVLDFPITLIDTSGAAVEVADREALRTLARECAGEAGEGRRGRRGRRQGGGLAALGESCVQLVFPVTVHLPEDRVEVVEDRDAMLALGEELRERRAERPRGERPSREEREGLGLQFPVDVTLADGTVETVEDRRELRELHRACED